jgi:hypothetical protein
MAGPGADVDVERDGLRQVTITSRRELRQTYKRRRRLLFAALVLPGAQKRTVGRARNRSATSTGASELRA